MLKLFRREASRGLRLDVPGANWYQKGEAKLRALARP
jgi:hypothetical protein